MIFHHGFFLFFFVSQLPRRIDGRITLSENIADNGGLIQAYHAYQLWRSKHKIESQLPNFTSFTHNQLFFIAYSHVMRDDIKHINNNKFQWAFFLIIRFWRLLQTWCQVHSHEGSYSKPDSDHAPSRVRVNSVLQNFDKFSETWNCPDDTKMNPRDKCQLWWKKKLYPKKSYHFLRNK